MKKAAKTLSNANHQASLSDSSLPTVSLLLSVGFLRALLTSRPLAHGLACLPSYLSPLPPSLHRARAFVQMHMCIYIMYTHMLKRVARNKIRNCCHLSIASIAIIPDKNNWYNIIKWILLADKNLYPRSIN